MGRPRKLSDDRARQVATTKARYGEDFWKKIGSMGGKKGAFSTPDKAREAINKRWQKEKQKV